MKLLWDQIQYEKFLSAKKIILALDYDGTLTPIVSTPKQAILNSKTRRLLNELSKSPKIKLCIVTGRSLAKIRKLVKVKKLILIANHGFEISVLGRTWVHPMVKKSEKLLRKILTLLKKGLRDVPGVFIENKKATLSVHYRNVPPSYTKLVAKKINQLVQSYPKELRLTLGKRVYEIRPKAEWDKGKALVKVYSMIPDSKNALKIYIGDDNTDEDAFKVLRTRDLAIRVGYDESSFATFYVEDFQEVFFFLKILYILLEHSMLSR